MSSVTNSLSSYAPVSAEMVDTPMTAINSNDERVQKLLADVDHIRQKRDALEAHIELCEQKLNNASSGGGGGGGSGGYSHVQLRNLKERLQQARMKHRQLDQCYPRAVKKALAATHVPSERKHALDIKLACFQFAYLLSRDSRTLLKCLRYWCRFQPVPGRSSVDQHAFALCVFAACKANLTVSTKRGVTLFSHCSPIADVLFGRTPTPAAAPRARKYEGVRPGTDTFNIPYSYLSEEAVACLGQVVCTKNADSYSNVSRSPFRSRLVSESSQDLTLTDFLYNDHLSSALSPLRARLIRLYCAHMIINTANRQDANTLTEVVNDILDAVERAYSYVFVIAKLHTVAVDNEIVETLRRARKVASNARTRCALIEAVRRNACAVACDTYTQRYMNERFSDLVKILFESDFI